MRENKLIPQLAPATKVVALVWLVTNGSRRLWCAFAGGQPDAKQGLLLTPVGSMTLAALTGLPGIPCNNALSLAFITSAARFEPMVSRVLSDAPDRSLVCFVGDMSDELDGLAFPYMRPQGSVKAAVELSASGWPVEWKPFKQNP